MSMTTFRSAQPCAKTARKVQARQSGGIVIYLVVFLALLALLATGASAYIYYFKRQDIQPTLLKFLGLDDQNPELDDKIAALHAKDSELAAQITASMKAGLGQEDNTESMLARIASVEESLSSMSTLDVSRANERLSLSEAAHLLRAAEWQLRLYKNHRAALYALEKANKRLALFKNHQAITEVSLSVRHVIGKLNTVHIPDIEKILRDTLRLQNLILELPPAQDLQKDELKFLFGISSTGETTTTPSAPPAKMPEPLPRYQQWYEKIFSKLIHVRDASLLGHLNVELHNQTLLWENLLLLVGRVQSAALHGKQSIYQNTLDEIYALISAAYPDDIGRKNAPLQLIAKMRQQIISVNTADLSKIREDLAAAMSQYGNTTRARSLSAPPSEDQP